VIRWRTVSVAAAAVLLAAGCASATPATSGAGAGAAATTTPTATATPSTTTSTGHVHAATTPPTRPLRAGERFVTVRMPAAYSPKAPAAPGTDDYRCFLLDPKITRSSVVTGIDVRPGNPEVVHHVILFRVPPDKVAAAQRKDREQPGQGWTCFGGSGLESEGASLDSAPWLGAWAPGGGERVLAPDLGMPLPAGSRIVMQVHYNLLAGHAPDRSAAVLRVAADNGSRKELQTMLLPAPVELPCRLGKTGPLCDRAAAMADVVRRFGSEGRVGDALHLLCPDAEVGPTQTCTRPVTRAATIRGVAGHMHLLGRSITVTLNKGKPGERVVLDIPVWDFDNQGSSPVEPPARIKPGDTLTVSCTHDQSLRDVLPAFAGQPERWVVWGEGTTDEMCLGIVLVTRP
jgi:hypothetical protein